MISLLDQYDGNPDYRKFVLELPNLNLQNEVDSNGKLVDNVISKILLSVNTNLYQAEVLENKVDLKFVLHKSISTAESLQKSIRDLGNSVGTASYDLSEITLTEL